MNRNRTWTKFLVTAIVSAVSFISFAHNACAVTSSDLDIYVSDFTLAVGDTVVVNVTAYDPSIIASITADGVPLTERASGYWAGTLTASGPFGVHPVAIEVKDTSGNVFRDTNNSYRTVPLVAIRTSFAKQPIMVTARQNFLFVVSGKVKVANKSEFYVDDGSGFPVYVTTTTVHNLMDGDYVKVRGRMYPGPYGAMYVQTDHTRIKKL